VDDLLVHMKSEIHRLLQVADGEEAEGAVEDVEEAEVVVEGVDGAGQLLLENLERIRAEVKMKMVHRSLMPTIPSPIILPWMPTIDQKLMTS
jgi:hypothetical protein